MLSAGDEAVFEFDEGERTHIPLGVGMIRDDAKELPAISGITVPDELRPRIEAIEDFVGRCDRGDGPVNCSSRQYTRASLSITSTQGSTNHRDHLRWIASEKTWTPCYIGPPIDLSISARGKHPPHRESATYRYSRYILSE